VDSPLRPFARDRREPRCHAGTSSPRGDRCGGTCRLFRMDSQGGRRTRSGRI